MTIRRYSARSDKKAVHRIWLETGWLKKEQTEVMDTFLKSTTAWVGRLGNEAECLACTTPGTLWYLDEPIPFDGVTTVSTSRIGRKRDLASRLTAETVADSAERGALLSALGMFEQGFYNRLGFGTGSYEHIVRFDPSMLKVEESPRVPIRISAKDWNLVHRGRLIRRKRHGSCDLTPPEATRADMDFAEHGFGLGYRDGPRGELTHHFWCNVEGNSEGGPYEVWWACFQDRSQFLELMALIKSLGDQVRLVRMREPPGVQFQDLLSKPFYRSQISRSSRFESGIKAMAYWQARICDLSGCLVKTHLHGGPVRFNLELSDPIEKLIGGKRRWRGIDGSYVVELGESSSAVKGAEPALPVLRAGVGAFTRLWLGIMPATGLAMTDDLEGPETLLRDLDRILRLPKPHPDWDF